MFFQQSLGIDIKNDYIAIVYLKGGLKGIKLASCMKYSLDKDKPLKEKLKYAADCISAFIGENRISTPNIFLGIDGKLAIFKELEFPSAVKENLRATLRYEMEKHIPLPLDDIYFDCHILKDYKGRLKLLLAVIKKSSITPYLTMIDLIDGGVSGIETDSTAVVNFIGYTHTSFGRAESRGRGDKGEFINLLSGKVSSDAYLRDSSKTGISSPDFIPAFGLALKGIQSVPVQINFIPPDMRKIPSKAGYYTMIFLICAMIISGIAWGGSYFFQKRLILKELDAEISRLVTEVKAVNRIQDDIKKIENRIDLINAMRTNSVPILNIMAELVQIMPETVWLQEFTFSEKGLIIGGFADSAYELIPLLENSPLFNDVKFASPVSKHGVNIKEYFRIEIKITPHPPKN